MDLFDCIRESEDRPGVEYAWIRRYGPRVVFMKLPPDATCKGARNPYALLAREVSFRENATVFCAVSPMDEESLQLDMQEFTQSLSLSWSQYKFIGVGEGAAWGLTRLYSLLPFQKMLLVNMPLTHELGETVELLSGVDRNKLCFVYGDADPSYRYTPLLRRLYAEVITVKGADHTFSHMAGQFVDLGRYL